MIEEKIIEYKSDEAAKPATVSGWISSKGFFFREEAMARYDGCTHRRCDCGGLAEKYYTKCATCRAKGYMERYYAMPAKAWDGKAMLFADTLDEYFSTPDEAEERAAELNDGDDSPEGLRLIICEPVYARQLDADYFCDDLPEDGSLPVNVQEAIDEFNKAIAGTVLSWQPGKHRLESNGH